MPKFDYWNDGYEPHDHPHHDEDHPQEFYDDFHYPHPHPMPPFDGHRHQPVDVGKVNTAKMHDRYDMFVPHHMPPWGFKFPKLEKAFVPGSTPQEQVAYLCNRVDAMIDYFNHYDDKVWGAYNAVVHSAFGNEAYYREITREDGYLADGSTPYTVIHIPYLDRAERPIFLELGLAYNNTTNNGVKENAFEASQGRLADKLIPAFNIEDGWEGKAVLKGAPVQSEYTEGKFTLAVTDNGFLKVYPNTVEYEQLHRDRIRNAMGVQGVLINNGTKTPNSYAENGGNLLARVGIGMNYDTKERLIVIVNGTPIPPNDESATGATSDMLADIFARYNCTVAVETANNGSAIAMDKGQMIYMPNSAENGVVPTVPSLNCYWYITKRRHYHNQYVRDVAELIQKVGQNKWRCEIALQSCDFLKGRVNELQRDLDAEVEARIEGDELLGQEIDAEAEIRRLADIQLQDNINAERDARVAGDNALDERITDEVTILNNRIDNEVATINALIEAEEQARIAGDTALQNSLTQLRNDYTAFLTTYGNDLAETRRLINNMQSTINTINGQIANLQNNLAAVNTSITAILATINTIEQSFENIKTAFTGIQSEWHDYKEDVDDEIEQLQQDWATYQATIISEVTALVTQMMGNYVLKTGDTMTGELTISNNSKGFNVNPIASAIEWKASLLAVALRFIRTDSNGGRIDIVPGYIAATSQPFIKFLSANAPFNGADVLLQRVAAPIANNDAANKAYVDSLATPPLTVGETYYIDPVNGDDTQVGDSTHPFRTLAHFNDIAKRTVKSGSYMVHLATGTYNEPIELNGIPATVTLKNDNGVASFTGINILNCNRVNIYGFIDVEIIDGAVVIGESNVYIDALKLTNPTYFETNFSDVYIGELKNTGFYNGTSIHGFQERFTRIFIARYQELASTITGSEHFAQLERFSELYIGQGAPASFRTDIRDTTCHYTTGT